MTQSQGTPNFIHKRFYTGVSVEPGEGGFGVELDRRKVRTPGKAPLVVPTVKLADAVAEEWRNQGAFIDPVTMPLTRLVNTAIDGVAGRLAEVSGDAARYACSDLLCYRSESPQALVARQAAAWDPVIAKVEAVLGVEFVTTQGIMPAVQRPEVGERVARWFAERDAFAVAALHVITTISGSCILAIAHAEGHVDIATVWALSLIDEDYQMETWGRDEEALRARANRWREIEAASRLLALAADRVVMS